MVDGYLEQFNDSKPRTVHANQSYIRQYGLFLKQRGYAPCIYPATLIQCPKDFIPYIFSKAEIYRVFYHADQIGPNKNKFVNTPYISCNPSATLCLRFAYRRNSAPEIRRRQPI